ncbi:hypothetical protein AWC38_SpisGene936 [Stylophora pistillata]|uniref:Uncharacterized protein n=1 Tax=Stylophora pistillata TaxID=50429 RepID=A0A2B4SW82_STYPI|nr:hypothetical protein AWC38_SpisGene936 [Stylophora pistillata]
MACKCFFETRKASVCSESSARLIKLSECRRDINDHLQACHLGQLRGKKLHKIKLAENMTLLQGQRPEESNQQEDEPYRLAKRMAAINLATVTSTPATTPPQPKANAFISDWTLGCRSGTETKSSGDDEAAESTSEFAMTWKLTADHSVKLAVEAVTNKEKSQKANVGKGEFPIAKNDKRVQVGQY